MRLNIRFKYWTFASTAALVLMLAGLFLNTAFGEFWRLAQDNGSERLALAAQYAAGELGAQPGNALGRDTRSGAPDRFLAGLPLTPNAVLLVVDEQNRILAASVRGAAYADLRIAPLTALGAVAHPLFKSLAAQDLGSVPRAVALGAGGEPFLAVARQFAEAGATARLRVIALAPLADFSAPVEVAKRNLLLLAGAILLLMLLLSILISRRVVAALAQLARNAQNIMRLDFSVPPRQADSLIDEVNALGDAQLAMHHALKQRTAEHELAHR